MRKSELIVLLVILLSFALGIYLYSQMPERMVSHWNSKGEVDGYLPKFWGLFLMPIISFGLLLLFILIPKIDPLRANIEKFRKYYDGFVVLLIFFLFYIYLLALFWNAGFRFNMSQAIIPAVGIVFYYIGILVEKAKRNWFVGIRTPWTLSSDRVWEDTHKLGGKLFKIAGIIALSGIFLPQYAIWLVILPAVSVTIYTVFYSYFKYQAL